MNTRDMAIPLVGGVKSRGDSPETEAARDKVDGVA
jgi:hypothetical protein